eukprot:g3928.t1
MLQFLALGEAPFADGNWGIGAVVPVCSGVVAVIYLYSGEIDVATISITIAVFPLLCYNTAHCIEVEVDFMNPTEERHHMRALYDITERLLHMQAAHDMNKVIGGWIQDYHRSDNRFSASVRQASTRADAIFGRDVVRRGRTPGFLIAGNTGLTLVIAESNFLTGRDVIFVCKTVEGVEELLPLVDELTATCGEASPTLMLSGDPWIVAATTTNRELGVDDTFGGVAVVIRADVLAKLVCGRFASFNKIICRNKAVAGVDMGAVSVSSVKAQDILAYVAAVRWGASFDVGLYLPPCTLTQEEVDVPYVRDTIRDITQELRKLAAGAKMVTVAGDFNDDLHKPSNTRRWLYNLLHAELKNVLEGLVWGVVEGGATFSRGTKQIDWIGCTSACRIRMEWPDTALVEVIGGAQEGGEVVRVVRAGVDVHAALCTDFLPSSDFGLDQVAETFAPSAEATWTEVTHYGAYHPPLALIEEAHLSVAPVLPVNFPKPHGCKKVRVDLSSPGAGVKLAELAEKLFETIPLTEEFTKSILAVYRTWERAAVDPNCFEIKAIPPVQHRARSEVEVQAETLRQALDAHRSTLLPVARHQDGDYAHFYRLREVKKTLFGASKGDPAPTLTRLVIKKQEYCGADNVARAVLLHNVLKPYLYLRRQGATSAEPTKAMDTLMFEFINTAAVREPSWFLDVPSLRRKMRSANPSVKGISGLPFACFAALPTVRMEELLRSCERYINSAGELKRLCQNMNTEKASTLHKDVMQGTIRLIFSREAGMVLVEIVAYECIMSLFLSQRLLTVGITGGVPGTGIYVPLLILLHLAAVARKRGLRVMGVVTDIENFYFTIHRAALFLALLEIGVPARLIRLLQRVSTRNIALANGTDAGVLYKPTNYCVIGSRIAQIAALAALIEPMWIIRKVQRLCVADRCAEATEAVDEYCTKLADAAADVFRWGGAFTLRNRPPDAPFNYGGSRVRLMLPASSCWRADMRHNTFVVHKAWFAVDKIDSSELHGASVVIDDVNFYGAYASDANYTTCLGLTTRVFDSLETAKKIFIAPDKTKLFDLGAERDKEMPKFDFAKLEGTKLRPSACICGWSLSRDNIALFNTLRWRAGRATHVWRALKLHMKGRMSGQVGLDLVRVAVLSTHLHLWPALLRNEHELLDEVADRCADRVLNLLQIPSELREYLMVCDGVSKRQLAFSELTGIEDPLEQARRCTRNILIKYCASRAADDEHELRATVSTAAFLLEDLQESSLTSFCIGRWSTTWHPAVRDFDRAGLSVPTLQESGARLARQTVRTTLVINGGGVYHLLNQAEMRTVTVSLPDVFYADPTPTSAEQRGDLAAATLNMALEHLLQQTEEQRLVGDEISDDGTVEDLDVLAEEEEYTSRISRPLTENKAAVFISPAVLPMGVLLPTERYRDSRSSRCITPLPSLKKGIAAMDTGKKLSEQADELLKAHRIPRQRREIPEFPEDTEPNMTETPPDWRGVLQQELDIQEEEQVRTFIQRVGRASVGEYGAGDEDFEAAEGENW